MTTQTYNISQSQSLTEVLKKRTFAEFFAGIGLVRLGLEQAGWSIAIANDIAEDKYEMYSEHFGDADSHFMLEDIHALAPESIPNATLATASFPCNDLSLAGAREGLEGKQSSAYWGFVHLLEKMEERRPPIVLLENVSGFLTSHGGRDFETALLALNRLGYVVDPFIIDAAHFVPQSRVRLFVVAHLENAPCSWKFNETPGFYESAVRPKHLSDFIFCHPEITWNLRNLPSLPTRMHSLPEILEDLPDVSPCWWNDERREYLLSQMSDKHAAQVREMLQRKEWTYGTIFRRVRKGRSMAEMRTDGIAGCLRTPRGGSGRQILIKAGYGQTKVRLLTPRECARLMGADDFVIEASLNKALFGFGDAVCVPVIRWIAENYLNPLAAEMLNGATKSIDRL